MYVCSFKSLGCLPNGQRVRPCLQKVLDQFGKEFTWDLKAKQMGKKALESAQVSHHTLTKTAAWLAQQILKTAAAAAELPFHYLTVHSGRCCLNT